MAESLESMFRDKTTSQIIDALSIKIYEPPLSALRERRGNCPTY